MEAGNVDTAESGEEAMARVMQKRYDLITLDIRMPNASRLDILSLVRNMCPHALIAIISGHFPVDISDEVDHCADVKIEKPIKLKDLATLIESAKIIQAELAKVRELDSFGPKQEA